MLTQKEQPVEKNEVISPFLLEQRPIIHARCTRYACRNCRTKTEWHQQKWCEMMLVTNPDCGDCRYWSVKKGKCDHPALIGGGVRK